MEKEEKIQNTTEQVDIKKIKYSIVSFILSFIIGIGFIYLFCWKPIGISYVIFSFFYIIFAILPFIIVEREAVFSKLSKAILILPLAFILSFIFLYRSNETAVVLGGLFIPLLQIYIISTIFKKGGYCRLNVLSYIVLPVIFLVTWIGDFFSYVKEFFKGTKHVIKNNNNATRTALRVGIGLLISLPIFILFLGLFSLADQIFAKEIMKVSESIFGDIFSSWDVFIKFIGKIFVGTLVGIYSAVFFFSIWNKETLLDKMMQKRTEKKIEELRKNFSAIITSTILFVLNIVFLFFVIIQFKYLFGGEENVLNYDSSFTYAEYAKKGFWELMAIAVISFLMLFIFEVKTKAENIFEKIIYKTNFYLLNAGIFIVMASAFTRMMLYEQVYGFTVSRLIVNVGIIVVSIMFVFLLISGFVKRQWAFLNASIFVMGIIGFLLILIIPYDVIAGKLNHKRYLEENKIDITYYIEQSDEIVPVLLKIYADEKTSETMKKVIDADLEKRYHDLIKKEKKWQSFNLVDSKTKELLAEKYSGSEDKYKKELGKSLQEFMKNFEQEVIAGNYENIASNYWTKNSEKNPEFDKLKTVNITKYSVNEKDYDWLDGETVYDYEIRNYLFDDYVYAGNYMSFSVDLEYTIDGYCRDIYDSKGYLLFCSKNLYKYDSVSVILENGEWKIKNARVLAVSNFVDGDVESGRVFRNYDYNYDYNYKENLNELMDLEENYEYKFDDVY